MLEGDPCVAEIGEKEEVLAVQRPEFQRGG